MYNRLYKTDKFSQSLYARRLSLNTSTDMSTFKGKNFTASRKSSMAQKITELKTSYHTENPTEVPIDSISIMTVELILNIGK